MTESRKLRPRGEFGPAGRELLRKLDGAYSFDDAPELEILAAQAAKTADMVDRLQRLVDEADSLRTTVSSGRNVRRSMTSASIPCAASASAAASVLPSMPP